MVDDMSSPNDPQETQPQPTASSQGQPTQKRKASAAGLDGAAQTRPVKRRASKACQCCRARKVRCNVTEHGAPCTNCRLDEVECIVSESRRKKKWNKDSEVQAASDEAKANARRLASRSALDGLPYSANASAHRRSHDLDVAVDEHVPHSIYQSTGHRLNMSLQALNRRLSVSNATGTSPFSLLHHSPVSDTAPFFPPISSRQPAVANLPYFIKPLPPRIGPDEVAYLEKKGVLTVPSIPLRNELLKAYIEFVHPYMPLLDLYDFIMIIESGSGVLGRISLILYQAVMFAGSAFVDMHHLHNAGYLTRKEARKDFFQKTRLLYDFDYESDRVSLVQALLLLTYYYETPDDQKDTWHWMGVATSVAHTIGLHRNPDRASMDTKRSKLWKRIWWSTYMRDRLIALGMRRPTRIKDEDYNVPMLNLDDFEFVAIPESVSCVPADCVLARDVDKQRELAVMCIEKAKLCLCISHVLSKQYCVLNNNQGLVNDRTTMMLLPKKGDPETCEVKICDDELQQWLDELPEVAKQRDTMTGVPSIDLSRSLLHMVFFTTLSALHRPQVLPSAPSATPSTPSGFDLLEISRKKVRRAASAITAIARSLDSADLVKYLPTTGVTVLLPAIIIHLLDIKAPDEPTRRTSLRGFCQCMQVMGKLRDIYAAADYSTAFLEAAIRKAGIHITPFHSEVAGSHPHLNKPQPVTTVNDLVDAGRRLDMASMPPPNVARTLTPPPDHDATVSSENTAPADPVSDEEVARRLETFLASTPPESDHSSDHDHITDSSTSVLGTLDHITDAGDLHCETGFKPLDDFNKFHNPLAPDFEQDDFDSLLNMDAVGAELFAFNDGGIHGFTVDMDWLGHGTPAQV